MTTSELANLIELMIPHLYLNTNNRIVDWGNSIVLKLGDDEFQYITYISGGRGGAIGKIFNYIENMSEKFCLLDFSSCEFEKNYVRRMIATKWLEIRTGLKQENWQNILDHIERLQKRTYENLSIVKNIIIDFDGTGSVELTDPSQAKLFDMMGSSNYVYFITDKNLNVIDYKSIDWQETANKTTYSSIPNFLQPFTSALHGTNIAIALTHSGDIVVYNKDGQILSIRKGGAVIYDNALVKNLYRDIIEINDYSIKCNLFDICWDLSYRRHGALIIVAKGNEYENHVVNKESILAHPQSTGIRKELVDAIKAISLKERGNIKNRSAFLELASVDGAIVIDSASGSIKAFGAIIETAVSVSGSGGARTTAAKSAIRYNDMVPIKISSDGDITLYKKSMDRSTKERVILEYNFY